MSDDSDGSLGKPDLKGWLEQFLPFSLPTIPLVQTALNVDRAFARLIAASGRNLEARVDGSTVQIGARSGAQAKFIEAGSQVAVQRSLSDDAIADRAMEYALGDAIEKQRNRENIAKLAIEDLRCDPPTQDAEQQIDPDWLNSFADIAATKTNADVQTLWARILSGEIRKPGSFGLRTLELLAGYDQADAKQITELFRYVFNGEFLYCWEEDGTIPYDLIAAGDETGVLRSTAFPIQKSRRLSAGDTGAFDAQNRWVRFTCDRDISVKYYAYALSRPGRELAALIGKQEMPEPYLMAFARTLKGAGFKVEVARRGPNVDEQNFTLFDIIEL